MKSAQGPALHPGGLSGNCITRQVGRWAATAGHRPAVCERLRGSRPPSWPSLGLCSARSSGRRGLTRRAAWQRAADTDLLGALPLLRATLPEGSGTPGRGQPASLSPWFTGPPLPRTQTHAHTETHAHTQARAHRALASCRLHLRPRCEQGARAPDARLPSEAVPRPAAPPPSEKTLGPHGRRRGRTRCRCRGDPWAAASLQVKTATSLDPRVGQGQAEVMKGLARWPSPAAARATPSPPGLSEQRPRAGAPRPPRGGHLPRSPAEDSTPRPLTRKGGVDAGNR